MSKSAIQKPSPTKLAPIDETPMIRDIAAICHEVQNHMRLTVERALHAGVRLLYLHRETGQVDTPGGFTAALVAIGDTVPRSTAYRWINAAANVLARHQGILDDKGRYEPSDLILPAQESKQAWREVDQVLSDYSKGMSLRRLTLGSVETSEDSRLDHLISQEEAGDKNATEILEQVSSGKLTLVQAVRSLGGKFKPEKNRNDPVYLDIDGKTGQPTGLFPKCLITIANTFSRWDQLDETARREVRATWKELVSKLPKDLR